MAHVRDEAICVRHWDFSETSQTVSLFCREHGLLRGLAKGAKRVGGRFSGGIDLLTRGEVVAIVKPGRELSTLTDWTLLTSWRSLRSDLAANQASYYLADLVQRLHAPADPHPNVYDALRAALDDLETGHSAEATLVFQWRILDEAGYRMQLDIPAASNGESRATLMFVPESGSFSASAATVGTSSWKVRRQTVELLARVADGSTVAELAATRSDSTLRANRFLAAYVRHIVGASLTTQRLLFPDL